MHRSHRVHLTDVACKLGVSVSTVSRAIAGKAEISVETRARVAAAIREQSLIHRDSTGIEAVDVKTFAVILPVEAAELQGFDDPFFSTILTSLADAAARVGHELLVKRVPVNDIEEVAELVHGSRAKGIVIIGQWRVHDRINTLALRGIPLVVWGAAQPGQLYVTVGSDNEAGARMATEHLVYHGCRRIVFLGDAGLPEVAMRLEGHVAALKAAGLRPVGELIVKTPFCEPLARQSVRHFLSQGTPFDGVFACSDLLAQTAIRELQARGVNVPKDIPVVGYDDLEPARTCTPRITSISQGVTQAGEALVRVLMDQCARREVTNVLLSTRLIVRESTGSSRGAMGLPRLGVAA